MRWQRFTGVSQSTIWNYTKKGYLKPVKVGERVTLFDALALTARMRSETMRQARTNKQILVRIMLERGEVTASGVAHISNSNQYFVELEKLGISGSRWHTRANGTNCKMRFIKDRKKAQAYLNAYKVVEAIAEYIDEVQDVKI